MLKAVVSSSSYDFVFLFDFLSCKIKQYFMPCIFFVYDLFQGNHFRKIMSCIQSFNEFKGDV